MKRVYKVLSVCLVVLGLVCPGCRPSPTAQLEENKAIVRLMIEELDKANWALFNELHAPNFVYHGPASPKPLTREELEQFIRMLYAAFPDLHHTIEDMIAEGDKVVARFSIRGTHKGEFQGIPATGKKVTLTVTIIFHIAGGKISEAWEEADMMGFMRQLGAIPG